MLKFIGFVVVLAATFAGGFFLGAKHRNDELLKNPEAYLEAYKEAFKDKAADKMDKIKKVLLED